MLIDGSTAALSWSGNIVQKSLIAARMTSFSIFRLILLSMAPSSSSILTVNEVQFLERGIINTYPPVSIASNQTVTGQTYGNGVYAFKSSGGGNTPPLITVPPSAMPTNEAILSSGTFVSSASSMYSYSAYNAFDKTLNTFWDSNGYYSSTNPYVHTGTATTTVSGTAQKGEWLQLQLPFEMSVTSISIASYSTSLSSSSWVVAGSQNGSTWFTLLDKTSTVIPTTITTYEFPAQNVTRLRIIFRNSNGSGQVGISDMFLFRNSKILSSSSLDGKQHNITRWSIYSFALFNI